MGVVWDGRLLLGGVKTPDLANRDSPCSLQQTLGFHSAYPNIEPTVQTSKGDTGHRRNPIPKQNKTKKKNNKSDKRPHLHTRPLRTVTNQNHTSLPFSLPDPNRLINSRIKQGGMPPITTHGASLGLVCITFAVNGCKSNCHC